MCTSFHCQSDNQVKLELHFSESPYLYSEGWAKETCSEIWKAEVKAIIHRKSWWPQMVALQVSLERPLAVLMDRCNSFSDFSVGLRCFRSPLF